MTKLLAAAFVMSLAGLAQAQVGGFGGGGMRGGGSERIPWYPSIDKISGTDNLTPREKQRLKAQGIEPADKKYIFVYIRPLTEDTEPRELATCLDAIEAARGAWAFVKMDFDKENAYQKAWGIKGAPACIGCDIYTNQFVIVGSPNTETIRAVLKGTVEQVLRYEGKLKYDYQKASDLVKTDEEKAAKLFVEICVNGKNGYKEVTESQAKLTELTEAAFRKGELASAVSPETGAEYYEDLVRIYRATAPGMKAEVFLAILDHARGNVPAAIQRLLRILKIESRLLKPEVESASKALDEISKAGDAKIEAALAGSDKALGKELVRKLAKEYAGTEAGKHAADASK